MTLATDVLTEWKALPGLVDAALGDAAGAALDEPFGPADLGLTRRQLVHHLAEANVVAASIVIAALGSPGCTYDWSWMMPFGAWLERLDYAHKPVEPARRLLEVLNAYVDAQVASLSDGLGRHVFLRDAPDAELRRATVAEVLWQEIDHAREHLGLPAVARPDAHGDASLLPEPQ
jgi:hypothetical protein